MKKNSTRFGPHSVNPGHEVRALRIALLSLFFAGSLLCVSARASTPSRERTSLNADWRFQKGDPSEAAGRLDYEKIKDVVSMTGNEFMKSATLAVSPERTSLG